MKTSHLVFLFSIAVLVVLVASASNAARVETYIESATGFLMVKPNISSTWGHACTSNTSLTTQDAVSACTVAGFRFVYAASIEITTASYNSPKTIVGGLKYCIPNPTLVDSEPCVFEDYTKSAPSCNSYDKIIKLTCTGVRTGGEFGVFTGGRSSPAGGDTVMRIDPNRNRLQVRRLFQSSWYDTCSFEPAEVSVDATIDATVTTTQIIADKLCKNFGFEGGNFFDSGSGGSATSTSAVISGVSCSDLAVPSTDPTTSYNPLNFHVFDFSRVCSYTSPISIVATCATNHLGLHCRSSSQGTLSGDLFISTSSTGRLMFRPADKNYADTASVEHSFRGTCPNSFTTTTTRQICKILNRPFEAASFQTGAKASSTPYSATSPGTVPVSDQVGYDYVSCVTTKPATFGQCTFVSYATTVAAPCDAATDQIEISCPGANLGEELDTTAKVIQFVKFVVPIVVGICIVSFIAMRWRMHRAEEEQMTRLERENQQKQQQIQISLQERQLQQQNKNIGGGSAAPSGAGDFAMDSIMSSSGGTTTATPFQRSTTTDPNDNIAPLPGGGYSFSGQEEQQQQQQDKPGPNGYSNI